MATDSTFFLLKPDALDRRCVGRILNALAFDFEFSWLATVWPTEEIVRAHYAEHAEQPFFEDMVRYMLRRSPLICGVVRLYPERMADAVSLLRTQIGAAVDPATSTIRHTHKNPERAPRYENLIHSSDSPEAVVREAQLWRRAMTPPQGVTDGVGLWR